MRLQTLFNDQPLAKATGHFIEGTVNGNHTIWLITNWHVLAGRNASDPSKILNRQCAIPNRLQLQVPSSEGPDSKPQPDTLFLHEKFINLYDVNNKALWFQHPNRNSVDIAAINLGNALDGTLVRGVGAVALDNDMAIAIGNEVFILGYPLGLSHFANTPIWKRGTISSEPHAETPDSKNRIVVDATTRSGMSGAPVLMRYKTHYITEDGTIKEKKNATRYIGVYASRPAPVRSESIIEEEAGFTSHEIGYVYKSGCMDEVVRSGIRGGRYGDIP